MQLKSLLLCSIAILTLISLNGSFTVFRTQTFDGKVPPGISERELDESTSDIAFDTYQNEKWRFYLACPWWYKSIWTESDYYDDGYPGNQVALDEAPQAYTPPIDGMGISNPPIHSVPSYAPIVNPDVKYKPDAPGSGEPEKAANTRPPHKPSRRNNGGGR